MEKEHDESDELEAKLREQGDYDETPNEVLKAEIEDEFEEPVEKTEADILVEQEENLTIPEQKWLNELELRAKEWKRDTAKQAPGAKQAIKKLKLEDFTKEDIELFRLFRCLQKSPDSLYFKQRFGQVLRRQERLTRGDVDSTSYQFTKVLKAISSAEQE